MTEEVDVIETDKIYCPVCKKTMADRQFYKKKGEIYTESCKKCMAGRVQLNNTATVMPIMEELDIPFVPEAWNKAVDKYAYDKDGVRKPNANQSVLGRYIASMAMNQYKTMTYKETALYMAEYESEQDKVIAELTLKITNFVKMGNPVEDIPRLLMEEMNEVEFDEELLSKNERIRLKNKWGFGFSDEHLVAMETFYEEMVTVYDIVTPTHEDQLKQIAKLSIQMHELLNAGDLTGYAKVSGAYDKMMKAAKFTAATQDKNEDEVTAIGELAKMAERKGFIPKYHIDEPKDIVDITLNDMTNYLRNLVMNELNLEHLITEATTAIMEEEREDRMAEENGEDLVDDFLVDGQATSENDLLGALEKEGYDLDGEED